MYSPRDLYEVPIPFYIILVKHALPIDLNVKFKVQLIIDTNQNFENSVGGVFLLDINFKMIPC